MWVATETQDGVRMLVSMLEEVGVSRRARLANLAVHFGATCPPQAGFAGVAIRGAGQVAEPVAQDFLCGGHAAFRQKLVRTAPSVAVNWEAEVSRTLLGNGSLSSGPSAKSPRPSSRNKR
jgi:hypothetical protein